jgi:hypothetical protein
MAQLAEKRRSVAWGYRDHAVVDLTGLKGAYDFVLSWTREASSSAARARVETRPSDLAGLQSEDERCSEWTPQVETRPSDLAGLQWQRNQRATLRFSKLSIGNSGYVGRAESIPCQS